MSIKHFNYILICCNQVTRRRINISTCNISNYRNFCVLKTLYAKQNYTLELLPEVTKLLETGEIKHRQHPGVQSKNPYLLPEVLQNSVYKILSYESEKLLLDEAKDMCRFLASRRLPMEAEEMHQKISSMVPDSDGSGNYQDVILKLPKHELKTLKRRIYMEVGRWKPIEYTAHECLVYLVGRLAAVYASSSYVLQKLKERMPSFQPTSYFDFGCGVGASLWATHSLWSDSIKEYFCIDASRDMIDLCQKIITDEVTEEKHIKPIFFRQFLPASETIKYDLVVSAFSLLDLSSASERLRVVDTLWRKTKDYLVIIEYGTVAGFRCVQDARDFIIKVENDSSAEFAYYSSGAYVVSPCPHDSTCPKWKEKDDTTCGFLVPYQKLLPRLKQVTARDWISYVILKKGPRPVDDVVHPRIVKPVLKKPKHIYCRLCCDDGNLHEVIVTKSKHGRHVYRCARESMQGDILPVSLTALETESTEESKS